MSSSHRNEWNDYSQVFQISWVDRQLRDPQMRAAYIAELQRMVSSGTEEERNFAKKELAELDEERPPT